MSDNGWEVPRVFASEKLLAHARDVFSVGGISDDNGRPSFEFFCQGPLRAATWDAERSFQAAPEVSGIRVVGQQFSKFFGPLEFLARETNDGMIELLDFVWDPYYWETVGDDPED